MRISWSVLRGADCIRVSGTAPGADVQVRPAGAAAAVAGLPPMAGRLVPDGGDLCFVPRFGFADGTAYAVTAGGAAATLRRPRPERPATTQVLAVYPTAAVVPRNLLRCYVWFSAPMSEGCAARHVRLAGDDGTELDGALLPAEYELWDGSRTRLTVLLDPARIKRGLAAHRAAGYPLQAGQPVRLMVGAGFRDAAGAPLRSGAQRRYQVGADERRRVDPAAWALRVPAAGSREPLRVSFGRPLDHGLLLRCLSVTGPGGAVRGTARPGPQEQDWQLEPDEPWAAAPHWLAVDPVLEDLAGNSVSRVFDRNLSSPAGAPVPGRPAGLAFRPG